jgi:hypothetical protein
MPPTICLMVRDFLRTSDVLLNPPPSAGKFTETELELIRGYIVRLHGSFTAYSA